MLHVSDTHFHSRDHRKRGWLDQVARTDYDAVVVTGDILGATGVEQFGASALASLTAGRPGLVVLGSNDVYGPAFKSPLHYFGDTTERIHGERLDVDGFVDALSDAGYRTIGNEVTTIEVPAGSITIGAIEDPHLFETVIPRASELATNDDSILHLGVVHAPYTKALDVLVDADHDVLLAGHTHGGQVRLPGVGALVANCDLPLRQVRGLSRYRDRWLHVSPGLGTSRFAPFRFACRPEVTILELS